MNKKILCLALLGAMGAAQTVMAQEYDDRWYIDGSTGINFQDNQRQNYNGPFGIIGVGKPLSPNWAVELNFNYQDPRENISSLNGPTRSGHWEQEGLSLDALYHFRTPGQNWNPYMRAGIGWGRDEEDYFILSNAGTLKATTTNDSFTANAGVGLEANYGRYGIRTEVGVRYDGDGNSVNSNKSYFLDYLASVGVTVALGPAPIKAVEPMAPPPPPPPPPVAKCPNVPPGTTVDADGCPVPVTIDLRGVNFDFDKSKLRPDAVEILSQAVEVLKKYPEMKVEVAGHTDSIGSDAYNQKLSERRAKAVYDYLTSNGVDAGRLIGPHGYGKTRPIAPNTNPDGSDNPQGRAENRRTELNVQN